MHFVRSTATADIRPAIKRRQQVDSVAYGERHRFIQQGHYLAAASAAPNNAILSQFDRRRCTAESQSD